MNERASTGEDDHQDYWLTSISPAIRHSNTPTVYVYTCIHKYSLSYLSVRPLPLFVIVWSVLSSTFIYLLSKLLHCTVRLNDC